MCVEVERIVRNHFFTKVSALKRLPDRQIRVGFFAHLVITCPEDYCAPVVYRVSVMNQ